MPSNYIFRTNAEWTHARRGSVEGDPKATKIDFSAPPEFQGESGFWSPEHFLLAAVTSCFVTTFRAIAEFSKFEFASLAVAAEGTVEKAEGGYQFTHILLRPTLTVQREGDHDRAVRLLEKTEHSCLISRSLKIGVEMQPGVQVLESPAVELLGKTA